ncbi:MAG: L,D-transpeptidase family protein [Planctomycetota bacterium]
MARRRLYVFGSIIILGVLIGIFCLPDSGEQDADNPEGPRQDEVVREQEHRPLLQAVIGQEPPSRAKELVAKAAEEPKVQEKYKLLVEAYQADTKGCWGGEAAAMIGDIHLQLKNTEQARQWYVVAGRAALAAETAARVKAKLAAITPARNTDPSRIKMLTYNVQPGDSLWKIARRYATTIDAIKKANGLTRDIIRVDKKLKIPKGPFDALVTKSDHSLQLLQDGKPVKVYSVGLGKDNGTAAGSFVVTSKLIDPVWYSEEHGRIPHGDPRNVLGSRWIGFNGRIGVHGTRKSDEHTIGKNMSDGCVRMRDADVKELYGFLVEGKSKITVVD